MSASDLRSGCQVVPFLWLHALLAVEGSVMLALIWAALAPWAHTFFIIACVAQVRPCIIVLQHYYAKHKGLTGVCVASLEPDCLACLEQQLCL